MTFLASRLPAAVAYGFRGGPTFRTDVIVIESGHEKRNRTRQDELGKWVETQLGKTKAQTQLLIDFYTVVGGMADGFLFKDHLDFEVSVAQGRLGLTGLGTGVPTYALWRVRTYGANTQDKRIYKPVSATMLRNSSPVTVGSSAGNIAVDLTTGEATFVADVTKNISSITKANPGVVTTSTAHGFTTGDLIYVSGVSGMLEINDTAYTITSTGASTFSVGVNTTTYSTYVGFGTACKYPQAADALTWSGEFDKPARFNSDEMQVEIVDQDIYTWGGIEIVEIMRP